MQIVVNTGLIVFIILVGSYVIFLKLNRQLSSLIKARICQGNIEGWHSTVPIRYQVSSKQMILQAASFSSIGITVGLLAYAGQWPVLSYITGTFAFILFYLMVKEIMRNFSAELERNRSVFMKEDNREEAP